MELKIFIIEDNLSYALELEVLLYEIGYSHVRHFQKADEAYDQIIREIPDLVLMDIKLGNESGVELTKRINHLPISVLYLTSLKSQKTIREASKTLNIGYLVKPIDKFNLIAAIKLAANNIKIKSTYQVDDRAVPHILVKNGEYYVKVDQSEISYIESEGNYAIIVTKESKRYIHRTTLTELEKELSDRLFYRIHRRYVINKKYVTTIDKKSFTLYIDKKKIPVSRNKLAGLLKFLETVDV